MPDVVIFLGPSLEPDEAAGILPGDYRPPIKRGDLDGFTTRKPDLVIIIDGLFLEQAAVGHKEILGLLRAGIPVIGSSSMGALRAAELEPFGMIGIGEVFRRYRDGIIESDDDVALICDPVTHTALSDALVNITITMESAVSSGILSKEEAEVIGKTARDLYYPDRTWKRILKNAPISRDRATILAEWVSKHKIDQKRKDAGEALRYGAELMT